MAEDKYTIRKNLQDLSLEELLRLKKGQDVDLAIPWEVTFPDTSQPVVFERTYTVRVSYTPHGKKGHIESADVSEGVGKTHDCLQTLLTGAYGHIGEIKVP